MLSEEEWQRWGTFAPHPTMVVVVVHKLLNLAFAVGEKMGVQGCRPAGAGPTSLELLSCALSSPCDERLLSVGQPIHWNLFQKHLLQQDAIYLELRRRNYENTFWSFAPLGFVSSFKTRLRTQRLAQ